MIRPSIDEMLAHLQEGYEWYGKCPVCLAIREILENQPKYDWLFAVAEGVEDTLDGHLLTPPLAAIRKAK